MDDLIQEAMIAENNRARFHKFYLEHTDRVLLRQNQPENRAKKRAYDKERYQARKKSD